jgi:hypothetical protein
MTRTKQAEQTKAHYPVNLLESDLGEEVSELLSHQSLQLNSGHQAWLLMAILYLVERERRKVLRQSGGVEQTYALARAKTA